MPLSARRRFLRCVDLLRLIWSWNEHLLWPLLVLTNPKPNNRRVGLATVQGSCRPGSADVMASALLGGLPLVLVFLLFQRDIVEGITGTGLKVNGC